MANSPSADNRTRVLFCTSGGLYGALVLARLLADPRVELAGVVLSTRVLRRDAGWLRGVWGHYRLSGLRYLLYLWCATGLADSLLSLAGRPGSVRWQARRAGAPLRATRDINAPDSLAFVDACAPDLLVSAFFNQRIDASVFERPRAGGVNIHPSLLPELKGVDPVFYGRLRGVQPLGVTVHRLAQQLDVGPVLAREPVPLADADSVLRGTAAMFTRGAELLLNELDALLAGAPGTPQAGEGGYDSWPTAAEVEGFLKRDLALVRGADLRALARGWRD